MNAVFRRFLTLMMLLLAAGALSACGGFVKGDNRHNVPLPKALVSQMAAIGSSPREAMMVRIYKQESVLEVWKRTSAGTYSLLKSYEICAWSGELGPKFAEGDRQAPEGFYTITPGLMHPRSNYHLAFNTGFPNKFDRAHGRTGSHLMVHGDCTSVGCYAMTDEGIAEIYAIARESFAGGNRSFQLQILPFRMTATNLAKHANSPHMPFWRNLKEGADRFDITRVPPSWDVCEKRYVFDVPNPGVTVLDAAASCPAGIGAATMSAALMDKQAADEAAISEAAARLALQQSRADAEAERAAREKAAIAARGEAIGGFFTGLLGGGGQNQSVAAIPSAQPAP
ncbi:L,D-transpeptidase family protein [Arsenicitalea aurantiaca]|uniref:L,D-transpeptidase family protein n=1 Tax=Arsenicitalea aurantiaca TaxID=1783274 RepID=UPI0018639FD1|nr:murein L,D-transpeptidase family protein [Arsenicitalea aurantiaca]